MKRRVVGVDIGGANLKYARLDDRLAMASIFVMWREPDRLCEALKKDLRSFGEIDALAVTMTGELADCFVDREIGVTHIVEHVQAAVQNCGINEVAFYGVDGQFHDAASAVKKVDLIAAANWHALASYVGKAVRTNALMVDIGSTTTDIIPIASGRVATKAETDFDRLRDGTLVYIGCRRTPVCAVVDQLHFRGQACSVMNELFAFIDDARIVLGRIKPDPDDNDSADGKPRSVPFAANRLARMIGLDRRTVTVADAQDLATQVMQAASDRVTTAINRQLAEQVTRAGVYGGISETGLVLSGHGQDLVDHDALDLVSDHATPIAIRLLSDILGEAASRAAPAFAVADLLSDCLNTPSH